jgi:hypothetical protein
LSKTLVCKIKIDSNDYSAHSNDALFLGMLNLFAEAEKQFKLAPKNKPDT